MDSRLVQLLQALLNHAGNVVVCLIVLLQAQQVLACVNRPVGSHVDVCQQYKAAGQPVGVGSALLDELQYLFFGSGIIFCFIQAEGQQIPGFGSVERAGVLGQQCQVGIGFSSSLLADVGFGAVVQRFVAVILADEATGNLDTRTSFEILVLFQQLHREGRTIIFVTHNPDIAQYSSRNIRLRDGHVIEDKWNSNILSAAEALAALPRNIDD